MLRIATVLVVAGVLGGCSGIEPGKAYPTETFTVSTTYQEAYRRAEAQSRDCTPPVMLSHSGNVYTDNKTAVLRVWLPGTPDGDLARVSVQGLSDNLSSVTITVVDRGIFDTGQIKAIRQSIETGKSVCREPVYQKSSAR